MAYISRVSFFFSILTYFCFPMFSNFSASCAVSNINTLPSSHSSSLSLAETTLYPTQTATPTMVVEYLHTALINVMKNAHLLGWQGRYKKLQEILRQVYDFPGMARIAAGSHWKAFTETQKVNMIEAFGRLSIATYASRFDDYRGERFETIVVEELPQPYPSVIVRTRLIKKDSSGVELSYRLKAVNGIWKIVDVFYRGTISELANQRAQYLTVLNQLGYERLLQRLDEKVKKLAVGGGGQEDSNDAP